MRPLPLMAATLLIPGNHRLRRVPNLADVTTLKTLLESLGAQVEEDLESHSLKINTDHLKDPVASYELVRTMRASILVLGPLLARCGHAKVSLPGGCAIGARPIDQHLKGLERLGATITLEHGYVIAQAPKRPSRQHGLV